jgi:hypothetical protein
METLITTFKDWPVIVQGALGSGLFWITLYALQLLFARMANGFSYLSKANELSSLRDELANIQLSLANGDQKTHAVISILYRMSRPFINGMLWLVLGLLLGSAISIFDVVGYIGSLYYFAKASTIVAPYSYAGDLNERNEAILQRITELEKNA